VAFSKDIFWKPFSKDTAYLSLMGSDAHHARNPGFRRMRSLSGCSSLPHLQCMFHSHSAMSTYPSEQNYLRVLVSTDSTFKFVPSAKENLCYLSRIKEYLLGKRGYAVTFDQADGRSFSAGWHLPDTSAYDVVIVVSAGNHLTKGWGQVLSEAAWRDHKWQATCDELSNIGNGLLQIKLGGGIMFVGYARDWPYLAECDAAAKQRYDMMLMESELFCRNNNIKCAFMSPRELASAFFDGLGYKQLRIQEDGCHFDTSAVVPLQRFLEAMIQRN
jgi:hypothetical protein